MTGEGELEIEVPRDRNGEFDPQLVKKGQRRLPGFDDTVIALYARGLTTREIQSHLVDIYGVEVSPALISNVTDAVLEDVRAWQSRPLDAIHLKLRNSGAVQNQAVYVALGINLEGQKDLLGLWVGESDGAKFWLNVPTELRNRGVRDIPGHSARRVVARRDRAVRRLGRARPLSRCPALRRVQDGVRRAGRDRLGALRARRFRRGDRGAGARVRVALAAHAGPAAGRRVSLAGDRRGSAV